MRNVGFNMDIIFSLVFFVCVCRVSMMGTSIDLCTRLLQLIMQWDCEHVLQVLNKELLVLFVFHHLFYCWLF